MFICKGQGENNVIYLDNSATTMPDSTVLKSFQQASEQFFANPSSIHGMGAEVERLYTRAREQAANLLKIQPDEVIFTSGGTEGNNLAIKGVAFQYKQRGKHIITTEIEHPSVYETCKSLEEAGFTVTILPVNHQGKVELDQLRAAITNDTILVSVMHVNNETGAIQPIDEIGEILTEHPKIKFHVDAVQSLGKVPLLLKSSRINLSTFSGHKIHGLKGTGMLYVRKGTRLSPLFHGGNQENGVRSGTENVAGNVAFVRALRLLKERENESMDALKQLQKIFLEGLQTMDGVHLNSSVDGAPHIMNVSVPGLKSETVIHALYEAGIVISTQSACSSKRSDISRVLHAYGLPDELAKSGLRISLSYDTTKGEAERFLKTFSEVITKLKTILE